MDLLMALVNCIGLVLAGIMLASAVTMVVLGLVCLAMGAGLLLVGFGAIALDALGGPAPRRVAAS
jgi:hypothetical protein